MKTPKFRNNSNTALAEKIIGYSCRYKLLLKKSGDLNRKVFATILFTISLMLIINDKSFAQLDKVPNLPRYDRAKYHFGFILAGNQMLFDLKTKPGFTDVKYSNEQAPGLFADSLYILSINAEPTAGFTIGIVSDLRMGRYFNLRFVPSLAFGERSINYSILSYRGTDIPERIEISKPVTSTYVELPLHVKYKSKRYNNTRGYLLAGVKYNIDLASNKKNKNEDESGNLTYIKLKSHDLLFEIGVGFDFYTAFFKFGTELKMAYGINDLLEREETIFTNGIEYLNSKIFTLSFTFE